MKQTKPKNGFIKGRFRGGIIALKGAFLFITTEASGMVQLSMAILLSLAGFYYELSPMEWMFHVMVWCMVLATEALNTAVEKLCDFIHDEFHSKIGFIKDLGAGAVTFAAIAAFIIELIIFIPKIF